MWLLKAAVFEPELLQSSFGPEYPRRLPPRRGLRLQCGHFSRALRFVTCRYERQSQRRAPVTDDGRRERQEHVTGTLRSETALQQRISLPLAPEGTRR